MAMPSKEELKPFRDKIDALDEQIIALIKERTAVVAEVGKLKAAKSPGANPLRPGREAAQVRHVMQAFTGSHFLPEAAAAVWRNFINASLLVEGKIALALTPDVALLAQDYFGSYTPATHYNDAAAVMQQVAANPLTIGVLPADADFSALTAHPSIKIFAKLPFVGAAKKTAYAFGQVVPEDTGDDVSVFWHAGKVVEKPGFTNAGTHDTQTPYLGAFATPITKK